MSDRPWTPGDLKVFIADSDENVPLEKRLLHAGDEKITDLTDEELFYEIPVSTTGGQRTMSNLATFTNVEPVRDLKPTLRDAHNSLIHDVERLLAELRAMPVPLRPGVYERHVDIQAWAEDVRTFARGLMAAMTPVMDRIAADLADNLDVREADFDYVRGAFEDEFIAPITEALENPT